MKNVKYYYYYYCLNFNLSWKKRPAKVKLSAVETERKKKGNERNLKPLLVTVRCFQLWENCSKERVEVFHDHLRLTTTDVSCQV